MAAGTATSAEFTTSAQLREIRSDTVNSTTGYTCLAGVLPACPVDLGTTTLSDVQSSPDTNPWNATASTLGGQVSQNSILGSTQMIATGSSSVSATAEVVVDASYLLVLRKTNPSTANDFAATFDLDEASTFSFLASGQIVYPDPNFPLVWDASLTIEFSGPSGVVGALQAIVDRLAPACDLAYAYSSSMGAFLLPHPELPRPRHWLPGWFQANERPSRL